MLCGIVEVWVQLDQLTFSGTLLHFVQGNDVVCITITLRHAT